MGDLIKLGKITAPVGIKGEVRVFPYTDEMTRFSDMEELLLKGVKTRIEEVRYQKNMVILKLKGIDDRNAAEALRDIELMLDEDDLWEMPEDTYLIKDLIGMEAADEQGRVIGTLTDVTSGAAQDLYTISMPDGRSFLLPAVKEFVLKVDKDSKRMTVRLIEGLTDL